MSPFCMTSMAVSEQKANMIGCGSMEERKFAILFAATILAARKLSELEAQGITRPCPAREIIITDAISKAEEIMRKVEKNYPSK
jgi:hypothetical protein